MSTTTTTTGTTQVLERTATPPSYLKYNFDLPEKRYVGLLACQRDPLLTTLVTKVVRCDKVIPNVVPSTKGSKIKTAVAVEEDVFEIELLDTVLFPTGGGQPSDDGTLTVLKEGEGNEKKVQIKEVLRRGLDAVHLANAAIEVGSSVRVDINVEGRYEKMAMHTGQHLLSGVIDRLPVDTLSWSLTPFPTPSYIELARPLTASEIQDAQNECNRFISTSANVRVEMDLEADMPSSVPSNYIDDADSKKERKGVLRTVEIENLNDRNPCCGTHFPSLSYLQALYILPHQTPIRGTNSRLYFLVGPRVFAHLASSHITVRASALELACATSELVDRVTTLQLNVRDGMRREKKIREELAGFLGKEVWEKASESNQVRRGVSFREEDATNSLEFLGLLSNAIKTRWEENDKEAGGTECQALYALASGGSTPSTGSLLIFGSEKLVMKAGKEMAVLFGARVKGGGKGRWQGKVVSGQWGKGDEALLKQVLENACS